MRKNTLIDRDYRYRLAHRVKPLRFNRNHALLLAGSLGLLSVAIAILPQHARAIRAPTPSAAIESPHSLPQSNLGGQTTPSEILPQNDTPLNAIVSASTAETADHPASALPPDSQWRSFRVKAGDSLAALFDRAGIAYSDLQQVLALNTSELRRIYPGDELRFQVGTQGSLNALQYALSPEQEVHIVRNASGFDVSLIKLALDRRVTIASGTIDTSLFAAAQRAGVPDRLTLELAEIFNYDVDFALDIRQGDRFTIVYEQLYKDGEKIRDGAITAAEFTNVGRTYQAIRFEHPDGHVQYYTPDGAAIRKAFLRTPVEFSRISSTFSLGRRHPVLNRIRAHKGVDYAAPTGTPVRATGIGKVVFRGSKGGYGSTIVLQHGSQFSTLYAHLSRFANGVRVGTKVQQGQVIGYVGQTGLATGPHLHYEFRVNDVHRDPLKMKFPSAEPISAQLRAAFTLAAQERLDQIAKHQQAGQVAVTSTPPPRL